MVVSLGSADAGLRGFWPEPEKGEALIFRRYRSRIELMIANENTVQDLNAQLNSSLTSKVVYEGQS